MTGARSPISFEVHVARLPKKGMPVVIDADEAQRAALAAAHGLLEVRHLHADLMVSHWSRNGVSVRGRVEAGIVQECGVTLEPLDARIEEEVETTFVPAGSRLSKPQHAETGELILDAEGPDAPEVYSGERIDVGALVEEFFALGIDPYPRKPGVELDSARDDEDEATNPFLELRSLRNRP